MFEWAQRRRTDASFIYKEWIEHIMCFFSSSRTDDCKLQREHPHPTPKRKHNLYMHVLVGLCANLTSTMESNRLETMRLAWAVLSSCSSAIDATRSVFKTTSSFRTGVLVEKEEVAAPTEPHGLAVRAQAAAAAAVVRVAARRSMVSDQYQSMRCDFEYASKAGRVRRKIWRPHFRARHFC